MLLLYVFVSCSSCRRGQPRWYLFTFLSRVVAAHYGIARLVSTSIMTHSSTAVLAYTPADRSPRTTVNQDTLGSRKNCERRARELLQRGERVVIDRWGNA